MEKIRLYEKNSIKNIYDILRIAFLYGESTKTMMCDEKALRWLMKNKLEKIDPNKKSSEFKYITPFGEFNLMRTTGRKNTGYLIIKDNHVIFWFNINTYEYLWLDGPEPINIKEFPEIIPISKEQMVINNKLN